MAAIKTLSTVRREAARDKKKSSPRREICPGADEDERASEREKQLNHARNAKQIHSFFLRFLF